MNPFDVCGRLHCGHYRGVHLPGVGCVWCGCDGFKNQVVKKFYEFYRQIRPF